MNLGDGSPLVSNQLSQTPDSLHLDSLKSFPVVILSRGCREWHPTKNKELTPKDFTYGSKKKYGGFVLITIVINQLSIVEQTN